MKIQIDKNRKLSEIKREFNDHFANLELGFHEKSNKTAGPPSKKLVKNDDKKLAECRLTHNSGFITILPEMTIGELKRNFRDVFGLTVEVFQKLKTGKLSAAAMEDLTVEELNNNKKIS